jgi:hypothetical protein
MESTQNSTAIAETITLNRKLARLQAIEQCYRGGILGSQIPPWIHIHHLNQR